MSKELAIVVDHATKRLIELSSKDQKNDDELREILSIVQEKAPKLLEGLTESNRRTISNDVQLRCYEKDEVVFRQNDPPDAYYTVIFGAVSIYASHSSPSSSTGAAPSSDDGSGGPRAGKFLMQLPPGASFGELSFNANLKHSTRSAGVVSDGSHGQSRVQVVAQKNGSGVSSVQSVSKTDSFSSSGGGGGGIAGGVAVPMKEVEASNVAVLLLVPEKTYMSEMFARHSAKHHTKDKIEFLKASFLFHKWPLDQLVKMAYAMKKRSYERGFVLARQGELAHFIWIIETGKLSVSQQVVRKHRGSSQSLRPPALTTSETRQFSSFSGGDDASTVRSSGASSSSDTNRAIDIAELGPNDIFGLVELFAKSKKMKRDARVISPSGLEAYVIPVPTFASFMEQEPDTAALLEKVVQKRNRWEVLRKDYAIRFPTMPFGLPKNAESMSNYAISRESVMSEKQIKNRKEQDLVLFRHVREARACFRSAASKEKNGNVKLATEEFKRASEHCSEAMKLAEAIGDQQGRETFVKTIEDLMTSHRMPQQS